MPTRKKQKTTKTTSEKETEEKAAEDEVLLKNAYDFTNKTWASDVILRVQGKKIHVSKVVLALHSPVFGAMFGSDFAERTLPEIPLPGKKYDDMLELFKCMYPTCQKEISDENIDIVLPLAYEYQIETLISKCEKWLRNYISKTWISTEYLIALFKLIEPYNMPTIMNPIMNRFLQIDPDDLFAAAERDRDLKQPMLILQERLMKLHYENLKKLQLQHVKSNIVSDNPQLFRKADIAGFETAKGAMATIIIDEAPTLLALCTQRPSSEVVNCTVVDIWGMSFIVTCTVQTGETDEDILPHMYFRLDCGSSPEREDRWTCTARIKLTMNCTLESSRRKTLSELVTTFSNMETELMLFHTDVAQCVKYTSGFVMDNKLVAEIFILANEPTSVPDVAIPSS